MENSVVEKTSKTPKEKVLFGLKIAGNAIFYLLILFILLFSIMNVNAGSKNGGFPNIFGKGFLNVLTNSMTKADESHNIDDYNYKIGQFAEGDLLFVDVVDQNNFDNLNVGDVITFFDEKITAGGTQGALNSHRIVYMVRNTDGTISSFAVQGDYSASISGTFNPDDASRTSIDYDLTQRGDVVSFSREQIASVKGVVTGVSYGGGAPIKFIQENWVWIFVIPVAIFLLVEIFLVVRNIMDYKGAKQKEALVSDKEAMQAELEAQKEAIREEMRKQLLAEMEKEKANNASTTPTDQKSDEEDGNKD